jgi:hypothetical protein
MLGLPRLKHARRAPDAAVATVDEADVVAWMAEVMAGVERANAKMTEAQARMQGDDPVPPGEVPPAPEPVADHQICIDCVRAWHERDGERRGKGSGQGGTKACPHCSATVWIDPRRIVVVLDGVMLKCLSCDGRVPVRHEDMHRAVPADAPAIASPSRWRRLLARV